MSSTALHKFASADRRFQVAVPAKCWASIVDDCRRAYPRETGGVLVGRYSDDLRLADITTVLPAPRDSKAGRTWFARGTAGLQNRLRRFWRRTEYYLGEWHYHPDGHPDPSGPDRNQMSQIAANELYHCPEPLLLIVGGTPDNLAVRCFVFIRGYSGVELAVMCQDVVP